MSKTGNFIAGLLTGAIGGTVLALLYAPDTGQNTRNRLSYKLSSYRDELNELIAELRKEKQKLISEAKEKGEAVVSEAKEKAEDLIREAEDLLHSLDKAES